MDFSSGRLPGAARAPRGRPVAPFIEPASGEQGSTLSTVSRSGLCARPTGAALGGARAQPLGYRQRQGPPPKVLRRERLESLTTPSLSRRRGAPGKPLGPKCLHFRDSNHAGPGPAAARHAKMTSRHRLHAEPSHGLHGLQEPGAQVRHRPPEHLQPPAEARRREPAASAYRGLRRRHRDQGGRRARGTQHRLGRQDLHVLRTLTVKETPRRRPQFLGRHPPRLSALPVALAFPHVLGLVVPQRALRPTTPSPVRPQTPVPCPRSPLSAQVPPAATPLPAACARRRPPAAGPLHRAPVPRVAATPSACRSAPRSTPNTPCKS